MYNSFNVLLNLVGQYFVESFCISIYQAIGQYNFGERCLSVCSITSSLVLSQAPEIFFVLSGAPAIQSMQVFSQLSKSGETETSFLNIPLKSSNYGCTFCFLFPSQERSLAWGCFSYLELFLFVEVNGVVGQHADLDEMKQLSYLFHCN